MNKVMLLGRPTRDPEIRYSTGSEPVCVAKYALAVNKRFKREGEPDADFINCVALARQANLRRSTLKRADSFLLSGGCRFGRMIKTDKNNG